MTMLGLLPTPRRCFATGERIALRPGGTVALSLSGLTGSDVEAILTTAGGPDWTPAFTDVAAACRPGEWPATHAEGYALDISNPGGVPAIAIVAGDERGRHYALRTLAELIRRDAGAVSLPVCQIADWPEFTVRGVIEGFYGRPWSHAERLRMIGFCGDNKLNAFFYAPKDDPFHRTEWRMPYPPEKLAELAELIRVCAANAVDFIFSVSPGNSVCFSGDDDFRLLCAKMDAVFAHGVRHFALLFDDIDPRLAQAVDAARFADSAEAQAYLANRLLDWLQAKDATARLTICPTEYCEDQPSPYRTGLARHLRPEIPVIWTGVGIVAPTISSTDADRVAGYFGHDLLLWDNYPVNDYAPGSLFLSPLVNRDPDLADHHHVGVVSNPMNQPEASKVALYCYADYLWNPGAYRPWDTWREGCRRLAGDRTATAFWRFCQYTESTRLWRNETPLTPLIAAFWRDPEGERPALVRELQALAALPHELRLSLAESNPWLLADIEPWFGTLERQAEAALLALTLRAEAMVMAGAQDVPPERLWERRIELERELQLVKADGHRIGGQVAAELVEQVLAALPPVLQFAPVSGGTAAVSTDLPAVPSPAIRGITNLLSEPGHPLGAMLDDDQTTCFRGSNAGATGGTRAGDYVGVDLGAAHVVSRIHVSMAEEAPATGTHFWRQVAVEGSLDGEQWETLIGRPGRPELATSWEPRLLRFVRVVSTLDQDDPLTVRAFRTNAGSPEIPRYRGDLAPGLVVDGRRDTYFLSPGPIAIGRSLTVDLGEQRVLRGIVVVQDAEFSLPESVVEVSSDRQTWEPIGPVAETATYLGWRGRARYLRLRTRQAGEKPARVHLFTPVG